MNSLLKISLYLSFSVLHPSCCVSNNFVTFIDTSFNLLSLFVVANPLFFVARPLGVVSVSLSVVFGVEEDQSESSPAHARHEGGAHHPAFGADQVDQEND